MVDSLTTVENVKLKVLTQVKENEKNHTLLTNDKKKTVLTSSSSSSLSPLAPSFPSKTSSLPSKTSLPSTPSLMTGRVDDIELVFQGVLLSPEHTVGDYHIVDNSILFCIVKQVCCDCENC
jgi:hypothetical protein